MCGVFGIVSRDGNLQPAANLGVDYLRNRGPDGNRQSAGRFRDWHYCLAHTRLAIIDLHARSDQPMVDASGRYTVVFNGELYNYRELRAELAAGGVEFRTEGDTEVLLAAWARYGVHALARFNGMFAFAVLDSEQGSLTLVRDRFGVKPLAWGWLPDGGFVFSSSVAAVASLVGAEPAAEYCARGCFYGSFDRDDEVSPFSRVKNLPGGTYAQFQLSEVGVRLTQRRWYDLAASVETQAKELSGLPESVLVGHCRDLLHDAVSLRLRSDVEVGCSLSGGLDSAAVAAVASAAGTQLHAFTYGHPDEPLSEGPVVARLADTLGLEAYYIWKKESPSAIRIALERTLQAQEAPFTTLSIVAQQEVFHEVRRAGIRVLLGGQGADEGFAGYRKFALVAAKAALADRQTSAAARYFLSFGRMLAAEAGNARKYLSLLPRYIGRQTPGFKLLDIPIKAERLLGDRGLGARQITDVLRWSLPTLLRYEDRNSMANGVESRLPFLDYRLMETALALPDAMKVRDGYAKWALRAAVARIVPDEVRLQRGKRGFDVAQDWIAAGMGPYLREALAPQAGTPAAAFLKRGAADAITDRALSSSPGLVAEALVALWMTKPVRDPLPALGPLGRASPSERMEVT